MKENLFQGVPDQLPEESFGEILREKGFRLERIVSRGHATPAGQWLSQEREEWVMLAQGAARLRFEGGKEIDLVPGDYLRIPAGARHRVEWTDPGRPTFWLALHFTSVRDEQGIARVKIIRSDRRKKTAGARLYGGTMYVYIPRRMKEKEALETAELFRRRFDKVLVRKRLNSDKSLRQVAEELNARYFGGSLKIDSIQYVTGQTAKFGSCNFQTRSIRVSHKMAEMPDWVRDYVVMHEICHLLEPGHDKAFWDLVRRYPLAERAKGFLLAKGVEPDEE